MTQDALTSEVSFKRAFVSCPKLASFRKARCGLLAGEVGQDKDRSPLQWPHQTRTTLERASVPRCRSRKVCNCGPHFDLRQYDRRSRTLRERPSRSRKSRRARCACRCCAGPCEAAGPEGMPDVDRTLESKVGRHSVPYELRPPRPQSHGPSDPLNGMVFNDLESLRAVGGANNWVRFVDTYPRSDCQDWLRFVEADDVRDCQNWLRFVTRPDLGLRPWYAVSRLNS